MPAADDDSSGAMASFVAAIGTADVGNATLQVDDCHSYPEAQVECAPCFCYDVTFQMKCVVLNFAVTCAVPGYGNWAIYANIVRQDGSVSEYRGLEHLQFLCALTTNAPPYSSGLEKHVDLVVAIKMRGMQAQKRRCSVKIAYLTLMSKHKHFWDACKRCRPTAMTLAMGAPWTTLQIQPWLNQPWLMH